MRRGVLGVICVGDMSKGCVDRMQAYELPAVKRFTIMSGVVIPVLNPTPSILNLFNVMRSDFKGIELLQDKDHRG